MLPNLEPFWAAGINPRTGLPAKFSNPVTLKEDIKKQLRLVDEQDAVNIQNKIKSVFFIGFLSS